MTTKFTTARWSKENNVFIQQDTTRSLGASGSKYAAGLNFSSNHAAWIELLESTEDVKHLLQCLKLAKNSPERLAQVTAGEAKSAENKRSAVLKQVKDARNLRKAGFMTTDQLSELVAVLAADNPDFADAIAALAM